MRVPDLRASLAAGLALLLLAGAAGAQTLAPRDGALIEDFIGRGVETSILLASGPGPGDAKFRTGESEIHMSKFLVDADLPFGVEVPVETGLEDDVPRPLPNVELVPTRFFVQPLIDLRVGVCSTERDAKDVVGDGPPFVRIQTDTTSAAGGVGLRIELLPWLHVEPRLTAVYGWTRCFAEGGVPLDRANFVLRYDRSLVNWRAETLTLLPILAVEADVPLGPIVLRGAITGTLLRTFTLSATSPLQRRERSSSTLRASVMLDIPIPGLRPGGRQVFLMPGFGYTRLAGDLGKLPETGNDFFDVTLGVAPDLRGVLPLVGRLGVSVTYVRGFNLEGFGWDIVWIVDL